jgi:preprotein translocase subunit SecE
MATETRGTPAAKDDKGKSAGKRTTPALFYRQVVAELRKVIWPTRKELVTYAVVVVIFIAVMMVIIAGYDYAFASAVQWVFGN